MVTRVVTERRPDFGVEEMSDEDIKYMLGRITSQLMEHGSIILESGTVESGAIIRAYCSYIDRTKE